jgi:hypothetical protein
MLFKVEIHELTRYRSEIVILQLFDDFYADEF